MAWGFPWQTHFEGEDAPTDTPENYENGSNPIQSTRFYVSHAEKDENSQEVSFQTSLTHPFTFLQCLICWIKFLTMKVKIYIKALAIQTISIPNQDKRNIQTKGFPFKHVH